MFHSKFKEHQTSGSEDELIFKDVYTKTILYDKFISPFPWRIHINFGFDWPGVFRDEDV